MLPEGVDAIARVRQTAGVVVADHPRRKDMVECGRQLFLALLETVMYLLLSILSRSDVQFGKQNAERARAHVRLPRNDARARTFMPDRTDRLDAMLVRVSRRSCRLPERRLPPA